MTSHVKKKQMLAIVLYGDCNVITDLFVLYSRLPLASTKRQDDDGDDYEDEDANDEDKSLPVSNDQ